MAGLSPSLYPMKLYSRSRLLFSLFALALALLAPAVTHAAAAGSGVIAGTVSNTATDNLLDKQLVGRTPVALRIDRSRARLAVSVPFSGP